MESFAPLERSASQQSGASARSHRSANLRPRKQRLTSQASSSASSIAASDKSLTSFPSFSLGSPRENASSADPDPDPNPNPSLEHAATITIAPARHPLNPVLSANEPQLGPAAGSIVASLTSASPHATHNALFEDSPELVSSQTPGALHLARDNHIERLIARHGAVKLIRQVAEDLAMRDAQMVTLRRRAHDRERALRKIILECGLSNLDLETRLRAIEQDAKAVDQARHRNGNGEGLSNLMTDAMSDGLAHAASFSAFATNTLDDTTIRATSLPVPSDSDQLAKGTARGWKDYLWGSGTVRKNPSRANSVNGAVKASNPHQPIVRVQPTGDRRPVLAHDLFTPLETGSLRGSSRDSSLNTFAPGSRKPSLASMALRLVVGNSPTVPDASAEGRGRAKSAQLARADGSLRTSSVSSVQTSTSARAVSAQVGPKALMAMRRATPLPGSAASTSSASARIRPQERWDTMEASPTMGPASQRENYGPVEMDTILPLENQPPTLTHMYNYSGSEYLTDRFGFIYDQRRKKRQRQAAEMARLIKKGSHEETLPNGRIRTGSVFSPPLVDDSDADDDGTNTPKMGSLTLTRSGTPSSTEEGGRDDPKPQGWQDYLKIATFPTELLSHTPFIDMHRFEVTEGGTEAPRDPGGPGAAIITTEQRGFVPSASNTTAAVDSGIRPVPESGERTAAMITKDDAEPVKLLLQNLNQLHDTLQRQKTVRWNEFLRKVRAERRREEQAAASSAAAEGKASKNTPVIVPEARLGDGELVGVASLGIQGKVGRAKANEFKSLILAGIPVAYRAKIWAECSGARALRAPGYYHDLINRSGGQEDDPQVVLQIKADITRTLTDNVFFRKGPGVAKLNEVLLAYSRRNGEVGYCQGMNLVAANLLLMMPAAEDAFWVLCCFIEHILPTGYFDHSLLASRADQQVLRQFVAEVLPRLSQHFDELSIDLETMTFQWFLSVFTDCLSAEALFRVWDVVLCTKDGGTFLFNVALALLKLNEQQLLALHSPASVYTYINHQMTNHAISIDGLLQASEGLRRLVRKDEVEARRKTAIEAERELVRQREERNAQRQAQKSPSAPTVVSEDTAVSSTSRVSEGTEVGGLGIRQPAAGAKAEVEDNLTAG